MPPPWSLGIGAPRRIHSVSVAIWLSLSLPVGGISRACHLMASTSELSFGLPGTITGPLSPPARADSRRSSRSVALLLFGAVALVAVLGQDRPDFFLEVADLLFRRLRSAAAKANRWKSSAATQAKAAANGGRPSSYASSSARRAAHPVANQNPSRGKGLGQRAKLSLPRIPPLHFLLQGEQDAGLSRHQVGPMK